MGYYQDATEWEPTKRLVSKDTLKNASLDELSVLLSHINAEIGHRKESFQQEEWKKVKQALALYIHQFGHITIHKVNSPFALHITNLSDFSTPGEIYDLKENEE